MTFFDNQQNAGIALIVLAVLSIIAAVVTVVMAIVDNANIVSPAITAVGSVIGAILYFGFGMRVRGQSSDNVVSGKLGLNGGSLDDKFDILVEFVHVFAFVSIIEGIFQFIGGAVAGTFTSGILSIIIGAVAFFCYTKIRSGSGSTFDKVIFIILAILFVLTIISGLIACIGIITIPIGIAMIIIGVFMLKALLDNDVKQKFGM